MLFLFRLAETLGRTVAELKRTMTASELSYWIARERIEPIGNWKQTGQICATLANLWTKKGGFKAEDFMPIPERKQMTVNEMMAHLPPRS